MAKETAVGKFIQDTPQWAKGVIAVAAIGAGYLIYRSVKKKADEKAGIKPLSSSLPANINTDIQTEAKKNPLSYPLSQYDEWANSLYSAMFRSGTDEEPIYRIMGYMKNNADVLQLIKAFGVRKAGWGQSFVGNGIVNKTLAAKQNPKITLRF
jgi:hypothetical protein